MTINQNIEIVVLALYMAAGKTGWAHLEDIAVAADKIAPGRFRWEKHKNFISDRVISSWLSDARKPDKGSLVVSRRHQAKEDGVKIPRTQFNDWRLTNAGVEFVENNKDKLATKGKEIEGKTSQEKLASQVEYKREKTRLQSEEAYLKWIGGMAENISQYEAEKFFRINEYIVGKAREERIERLERIFADDFELLTLVKILAHKIRENGNVTRSSITE